MRRMLDRLYLAAAHAAAAGLFGIFLLMLAQIAARETGHVLESADDIAGYACVTVAFLALADTFRRGELIRVDLVLASLPAGGRRVAEGLALGLALLFSGYLTVWTGQLAFDSWTYGELSQGSLPIPLWIPQLAMPLGAAVLAIAVAEDLVRVARNQPPRYLEAQEERRRVGDFSSEL